ncbi:MAG: AraC family transcriptional regulator [Limnobacter sp.]|uniref:AraC family transcriptional regulator n=1 Tax=Limnobacter sp. TaxID=2003368 RepID=UPI00391DF946
MTIPLHRRVVPVTYAQLLHDYVESKGFDPEKLLGEPWPQVAADGSGGISIEHWANMLALAEKRLDDPLIALHLGASITVRHLGILGAVLLACDNFAAALHKFDRYQRLIFDVIPMIKHVHEEGVDLTWDNRGFQPGRLVDETGFAVLIQFCRSLVRGSFRPLQVQFMHPAPADITPYETYFGCEVRFGQREPMIQLSHEVLALPLKSPDPILIKVLEQHADRLLSDLPQQDETVEQVRRAIADVLHQGEPDIERVSVQLGLSSRTLQKRLQHVGTCFRDELGVVRHQLATSYLRDPRLQVVEIALLLGYSEHSAFTRAFTKWTGKSPVQWKQQIQSPAVIGAKPGIGD